MIVIVKAKVEDSKLLADIGRITFVESHGSSASMEDIDEYVNIKYNYEILKEELSDLNNIYHIIYHDKKPAGYSKIILNVPHSSIPFENVTKLERLYLLKEFYSLKLGLEIFHFNMNLSKINNQVGMWLYVWKENDRAIRFYEQLGFLVIGSYDFKLTETHSNPNFQMYLKY